MTSRHHLLYQLHTGRVGLDIIPEQKRPDIVRFMSLIHLTIGVEVTTNLHTELNWWNIGCFRAVPAQ